MDDRTHQGFNERKPLCGLQLKLFDALYHHKHIKGNVGDLHLTESDVGIVAYEPGNMGRYELIFGYSPAINKDHPRNFFCAWMSKGGSGGSIVKVMEDGYTHWSYVKEKLSLHGEEDAKAITHFINSVNCDDYAEGLRRKSELPRGYEQEQWTQKERENSSDSE